MSRVQFSDVKFILCNHRYPAPELFILPNWNAGPLKLWLPAPSPNSQHSTFYLYGSDYAKYLIQAEYSIYVFMWLIISFSITSSSFIHTETHQNFPFQG